MLFKLLKKNSSGWRFVSSQIKGSGKDGEITSMDILKWRTQQNHHIREIKVGGQTQKWNYRSEIVQRHGLDNNHKFIWIAFGVLIVIGFSSFVAVKTSVIENRRQAMQDRELMRKQLHLQGEDRKKIGVV